MRHSQVIEPKTREELELMDVGQLVRRFNRIGVYAGLEWTQICSCPCPNTFQFPVIMYPSEGGKIEREVVRVLNRSAKRHQIQVQSYSTIGPVKKDNRKHEVYEKLLRDNLPHNPTIPLPSCININKSHYIHHHRKF